MWDTVLVRAGRISIVCAAILALAAALAAMAGLSSSVSSVDRAVLATSAPTAGSRVHFKVVPSATPTHSITPTSNPPTTVGPTTAGPTGKPTKSGPLATTGNGPVVDWLAGSGAVLLVGGVIMLLVARERRAGRRRAE